VIAAAARTSPGDCGEPRAVNRILDALATRLTDGHAAAAAPLTDALAAVRSIDGDSEDPGRLLRLGGNRVTAILATELWDFETGRALAELQVQAARDAGALVQLQFAVNVLAANRLLAGELTGAAELVEEDRMVAAITGNPPVGYAATLLAALRGPDEKASRIIAAVRGEAWSLGQGRIVTFADYATAVLNNGFGRHDIAALAAREVFDRDVIGGYQVMVVSELAEACSRTGDMKQVAVALERMSEHARATPTDWALGIEARLRALLCGDELEESHRESIRYLDRAGLRLEVARGQLLYGEWLRRVGQRIKAREQLGTAYNALLAMGAAGFAERARRELALAGGKAHKRNVETAEELTVQEFHIARFARDGMSNIEIGTRLFLSSRTVEWHLGKVFTKLGVSTRRDLRNVVLDVEPD
jgi:DNA-binding CsgD family transcriptional regulator